MRVIERADKLREVLDAERCAGRSVGLVPTMGALHDGHLSLIRRSAAEREVTCVTVFVNPLQFGEGEDFDAYPRDLEQDVTLATRAGADLVFAPGITEMYADEPQTVVAVAGAADGLEGAHRPGHFAGVATVVAKLFAVAGPCAAYFGEKDFQQLVVVRRMAHDLSFPVEVVGCPTVRDLHGLALSSRNAYLSDDEHASALVLYRALRAGAAAILAGERDPDVVRTLMTSIIEAEPAVDLDYAEVTIADTLRPADVLAGELRLLVAARVGKARLIDNVGVRV